MGNLNFDQFHAKFGQFCQKLSEMLQEDDRHVWTRCNQEFFNHKMTAEVSVWWGTGSGEERGHIFLAQAGSWDGKVDWPRIYGIIINDELALGANGDTTIRVWGLGQLETQTEPRLRCDQCGKLK